MFTLRIQASGPRSFAKKSEFLDRVDCPPGLSATHVRNWQSNRRWWICLLLLFVSASMFGIDRDRRLDQLYHTKWTYADGAPAEIFALAQTADDYLWIGTTTGLVRFDGIHFQRYESIFASALEGRNVCSLLAMPDGGLWIGFAFGGVSYLKDGQVKNYREKDGAPSNSVRALDVDRHGMIWAAALGGLPRFDGAKWSRVGSDWNIAGVPTTDLVDRQGTLWVASGSNLDSLREGAKQFELAAKAVGYTTRLTQAPDGTVWLSFIILPAFYQTYWFRGMEWMAAAGLLWLLYWLRLRQVTWQIHERLGAKLEERERIARELHETLLQGFQRFIRRFQAVMKTLPKDGSAFQMMVKAMDRADHVLLDGRQSVRDLREAEISGRSLSESLIKCGEELAHEHSSQFSVAVLGMPLPLSPVVYSEIERIAREALMNAFQHSRAARIEVELTYGSARLSIRIRDNGIGIDEGTLHEGKIGHWGLSGMRERAQMIGAQLKIWSTANAGTEIELLVPGKVAYSPHRSHSLLRRFRHVMGKRQKEQTHDE